MSDLTAARKVVRAKANEAEGWVALDAMLGEAGDINRLLAELKAEAEKLARDNAAVKEGMMEAEVDAHNRVHAAEAKAAGIVAAAEIIRAEAELFKADAEGALAAARDEADRLVEQGKADAKKAAEDADGRLGALRLEINAATVRRDDVHREIAEAATELATVRDEIERLKARFR